MATIAEQEALIATLKFTPCTYRISLWGYGGEVVMGTVDRKVFDYFKQRRLSVLDFAWSCEEDTDVKIPEEFKPFEPGAWYECDNIAHASGVAVDSGTIEITDENGDTVLSEQLEDLSSTGAELTCDNETWVAQVAPGKVVFVGRSNEKGTFYEGSINLTAPFDASKLEVCYEEIDGEQIVSSVYYDGEYIDNDGGSTDGKSSEFCFCLVKDDKTWEKYEDHNSIEYPLTEWFPKKVNPVRTGVYEITSAGKNSHTYHAKWTGTRWIVSWADDTPESESLAIKQWRGIIHDPDAE